LWVTILQLSHHMSSNVMYEFLYDLFKRVLTQMLYACRVKFRIQHVRQFIV